MQELLTRHSEIMDGKDPEKKIGLIVDEWGTWYDVEPGTNPGFLYQQNTLRDALVAGTTLNLFNNHCDRVKMANIAQLINVLQAVILTDKEKMLLTPTYHVFQMFAVHQDAKLLPADLETPDYQRGSEKIPAVNASASRDSNDKIHVTLCNLNAKTPINVTCQLDGSLAGKVSGRVLTALDATAHNTFDKPESVKPVPFNDAKTSGAGFTATLPPKSLVVLEIEK
jgi:alpha-N-arabinofuranosidase